MRRAALAAIIEAASIAHAGCPDPLDMDQAMLLVEQEAAEVQAAREIYRAQKKHDWSATVTVSYALAETQTEAQGINGRLTVTIPLFSGQHREARARAHADLMRAAEAVRARFLAEVEQLCAEAAKRQEFVGMAQVYRDRLRYTEERVHEGVSDPEELWERVEKVQKTEQKAVRASAEIEAARHMIARRFGGRRWRELMALLP